MRVQSAVQCSRFYHFSKYFRLTVTVFVSIDAEITHQHQVLADMKPAKRLEDFTYADNEMAQIFREQVLALNFIGLSVSSPDIRDRSQTLFRGPDAKRGPIKFLTLVSGPWKTLAQIFQ